jgi:hypothetical protein
MHGPFVRHQLPLLTDKPQRRTLSEILEKRANLFSYKRRAAYSKHADYVDIVSLSSAPIFGVIYVTEFQTLDYMHWLCSSLDNRIEY